MPPQPDFTPTPDKITRFAAMSDNLTLAFVLAARGWYVFPCNPDKTPKVKWKEAATTDPATIRGWWGSWPDALIGLYCEKSGIFAMDLDRKNQLDGVQAWAELVTNHGGGAGVAIGPIQRTPSGGYHFLFRLPADLKIPNNASKLAPGIDLRSNGYICTGAPYAWQPDHDHQAPLTDAPAWLLELIRNLSKTPERQPQPMATTAGGDPGGYWLNYYLDRATVGNRNEAGFDLACQLRDSGLPKGEAESIMVRYAARVPQSGEVYTEDEAKYSLQSAYSGAKREAARLPGVRFSSNGHKPEQPPSDWPPEQEQPPAIDDRILLTDMGNARRFAMQHGGRLRYVKRGWGWTVYTGKRWEQDETGRAMTWAKATAKAIYREAEQALDLAKDAIRATEQAQEQGDESAKAAALQAQKDAEKRSNTLLNWAIKSQARPRLEATLALGESEPEISARSGDFDRNPWALNCQNGILDLQTGELSKHTPEAMITRLAGAAYDPEASCPKWEAFLERIFNGDQELIGFIRRSVGYSLTGNTGEQCLYFLYGTGKNGKSTFTGALQALLGDYSSKTLTDTLMVRHYDGGINNDLARLSGARAVIAAELAEGKRLNESLIKDLTGGDVITARYLRQEYFEFTPVFKLWMYGNHKPIIRGTDEGIWRRMKLIPFTQVIPESERDPAMLEKLKTELIGILAWAVRGCLEWQRIGLQTPATVDAATAAYRAEQDTLAQFLAECCLIAQHATVTAKELHDNYQTWGGELNQRRFSQALAERGYTTQGRDARGRALYRGIGLLDPVKSDND